MISEYNKIDINKICKKSMELIEIINLLANSEMIEKLYFVDIKYNNVQSLILQNIYLSLLQVAELENRNIDFCNLFLEDKTDLKRKIYDCLRNQRKK